MNNKKDTLIFVYNANRGLFSKATDFTHKLISPTTYNCSLCSLTYGNFFMEKKWANFITELDYNVQFSYKNNIKLKQLAHSDFPMLLFRNEKGTLQLLLNSIEINKQKTLEDLMRLVEKTIFLLKEQK